MSIDLDPQIRASDPDISAFVTAHAGSGKTTTLVNRVARLLLRKVKPEAVLCLTYTKAAAAEMQRRLFNTLGDWSVMEDAKLRHTLANLEERPTNAFSEEDISDARALFARALESPGGLKIQTIHAFCERLLRRFPLEAGLAPGFKVMEDAAAARIAAEARDKVAMLVTEEGGLLAEAYDRFATRLSFDAFEAMFASFETRREDIAAWIGGVESVADAVRDACGLEKIEDPDVVEQLAVSPPALNVAAWRRAAEVMQGGGKSDQERAAQMWAVIKGATEGPCDVAAARACFFTTTGLPRARMANQGIAPEIAAFLLQEQGRIVEAFDRAKANRVARDTLHAMLLADAYGRAYDEAKRRGGWLDFADLISRTAKLMGTRPEAAWVLYKLDGGIDHLLIDEAQDTAPEQWDIVQAITQEFFSGAGAREVALPRSLFVVGDEKQSIFSFQGARPERLRQEFEFHLRLMEGGPYVLEDVPLTRSYRSVPQVLNFVDHTFRPPGLVRAILPRADDFGAANDEQAIEHLAQRAGHAGCVDLWPLDAEPERPEPRAWDAPVDSAEGQGAHRALAMRIATEIASLIQRGDQVFDKTLGAWRAAHAGDCLILVRRRGVLFGEVISALKRQGLPVAGADRLALAETSVFEDLLAAARFALFPEDDLTLAAILRGPLCAVSEDQLYDLARGRKASLWRTLIARRAELPVFEEAAASLSQLFAEAPRRAPFAFFGRLLARLDGEGRSMRQRLRTRLGPEAEDAIDEFLAQVLVLEQSGVRDLESVADALAGLDVMVKRELDEPKGEVRVMTTHGAKGLEAPIVFLPETVVGENNQKGGLLQTADGAFLWCASSKDDCAASTAARELRRQREEDESYRLLYVALTRARDRLVIGGRQPLKKKEENLGGWWRAVDNAFSSDALAGEVRQVEGAGVIFRRFGPDPATGSAAPPDAAMPAYPLPEWTARPAPAVGAQRYASPSSVGDLEAQIAHVPSPLDAADGLGRFRRGELIHKLLQLLPDIAPDARRDAAGKLLAREQGLSAAQIAEMAEAALIVLEDPQFAPAFGPGARAEVALAGASPRLPAGLAISGRMDRLVVEEGRVLVVDYKTNRPAPDDLAMVDPVYLAQMATYWAVLAEVFPGRAIEAALVWTDGPKLMPIPENLLLKALDEMARTS
ncbi:MAG: double-strand break repair helicase AddA [Caulobacteraceae bacterium]